MMGGGLRPLNVVNSPEFGRARKLWHAFRLCPPGHNNRATDTGPAYSP